MLPKISNCGYHVINQEASTVGNKTFQMSSLLLSSHIGAIYTN